MDLNDLQVFAQVAALGSFSKAAHALAMPKSTVSRCIARLEATLGIRLLQRTTREVMLTEAGRLLHQRAIPLLSGIGETVDFIGGLAREPRGLICISSGIGFGINVLSELLPAFVRRYPGVELSLDLTSREAELVQDRIDVAIRMGPVGDSSLIASRLGRLPRYLCASPEYLERRGQPVTPGDLSDHDCIEMPGRDGRARTWTMHRGGEQVDVALTPRISVNDALTIHNLARNGAGIAIVSGYLCGPDFTAGRLIHVLPDWTLPPVDVSVIYPSRRELSPGVRALVDFLRENATGGQGWQADIAD